MSSEVVIACGAEIIARHPRSYEREDFVFDPLHYRALLEHKIGALDQAAPLVGWNLPEEFATLRRLIVCRLAPAERQEHSGSACVPWCGPGDAFQPFIPISGERHAPVSETTAAPATASPSLRTVQICSNRNERTGCGSQLY